MKISDKDYDSALEKYNYAFSQVMEFCRRKQVTSENKMHYPSMEEIKIIDDRESLLEQALENYHKIKNPYFKERGLL